VVYVILANLAYTSGPAFDTIFYRGSPRIRLFRAGHILSLVVTALPGLWAVTAWLITVATGQKM
jgi:hypothetical protein